MSLPSPERILLWADVTEFTRAMETSEPLMAQRTAAWVDGCTQGWLNELGGEFLQQPGDALILAFDVPELALQAAQRLQNDWLTQSPLLTHEGPLPLRIALHWGSVWRGGQGYVGHSLNQLARLAQHVKSGEIWVSAEVWNRLSDREHFKAQDLGWMYFKHLHQPLRAFRLPPTAATRRTPTAQSQGDLPRVLVLAGPPPDELGWAQNWVQRLETQGLEASGVPWAGFEPDLIDLLQQTRADFLLRRVRGDPQDVLELRASPQALVLRRWSLPAGARESSALEPNAAHLLEAMQLHSGALALTQPDRALSHGMLRLATLHLMHDGSPQQQKRITDLLETWTHRQPRLGEPSIWRAQWEVLRHTRGQGHGDAELALHHANQALRLTPDHGLAWANRGFVLAHLHGDLDRGMRDLEQADQCPGAQHWTHLYRSVLLSMLRQPAQAQHQALQAMHHPPGGALTAYAWGLVGHATLIHGQARASIGWLEASWRAQRRHSPTLRMLVVGHQMLGQLEMAALFLRELLALDPTLTARSYMGRTRAGHGLRAELAHWLMAAGLPMK